MRCPVQSATQAGASCRNWVVPNVSGQHDEERSFVRALPHFEKLVLRSSQPTVILRSRATWQTQTGSGTGFFVGANWTGEMKSL
jgi:hypothetical protein